MIKKILILLLFVIGGLLHGQENLKRNPMNTGQFSRLNNAEKIEYIKKCFREGVNVPWFFAQEFAEAGGKDIIPYLLEELPKYEDYRDVYDERLSFITNALIYFRNTNVLTLYERYYIAGILEGKIINYLKRYKQYDLLVSGTNANIWMFLNPNYTGQLPVSETDEIIQAKYRTMGLLD